MNILKNIIISIVFFFLSQNASSSFYQADTMASYCQEYIKLIELGDTVNQLEAGICSGYVASTIELVNLSGSLCGYEKLNLDIIVQKYIDSVFNNEGLGRQSATYVIVELLQKEYACNKN